MTDGVFGRELLLFQRGGFALFRRRQERSALEMGDLLLQSAMLFFQALERVTRVDGCFRHTFSPHSVAKKTLYSGFPDLFHVPCCAAATMRSTSIGHRMERP